MLAELSEKVETELALVGSSAIEDKLTGRVSLKQSHCLDKLE